MQLLDQLFVIGGKSGWRLVGGIFLHLMRHLIKMVAVAVVIVDSVLSALLVLVGRPLLLHLDRELAPLLCPLPQVIGKARSRLWDICAGQALARQVVEKRNQCSIDIKAARPRSRERAMVLILSLAILEGERQLVT